MSRLPIPIKNPTADRCYMEHKPEEARILIIDSYDGEVLADSLYEPINMNPDSDSVAPPEMYEIAYNMALSIMTQNLKELNESWIKWQADRN